MTKKSCSFVRGGNAPLLEVQKRPGFVTLIGASYRHSWQPRTEDDAVFDELMDGSMFLNIDSTLVAIKHVPVERSISENVLVVGVTAASSVRGLREGDILCDLLKKAKQSGWRCIAACLDTGYLHRMECTVHIDMIVCRTANKPWTSKDGVSIPICATDDVSKEMSRILYTACEIAA